MRRVIRKEIEHVFGLDNYVTPADLNHDKTKSDPEMCKGNKASSEILCRLLLCDRNAMSQGGALCLGWRLMNIIVSQRRGNTLLL